MPLQGKELMLEITLLLLLSRQRVVWLEICKNYINSSVSTFWLQFQRMQSIKKLKELQIWEKSSSNSKEELYSRKDFWK